MSQHISNAHDNFFRESMKDLRIAREFFQMHLPQDLQESIQWDSLELQPSSYSDILRSETISDIVFKILLQEKEAYLHLMVEHQSTPDVLMAFRAENYRSNLLAQYIKQHPDTETIPLVISLVIYHGRKPWRCVQDVRDLVDAPEDLVKAYAFCPYILIDLNHIKDEMLRESLWSGVMQLALKHIFAKNILPHIEDMVTILRQLEQFKGIQLVENVLVYALDRGEMDKEAFFSLIRTQFSPDVEDKLMTVSEQLRAEGMQQGMQQGMHLANLKTARELLREGMSEATIARITDLSIDEIRLEAQKINH
jgi:predicted transposase/invertase (TIGR01784 family)